METKKLIETEPVNEDANGNKETKLQTFLGLVLGVSSLLVIFASTICVQLLERRIPDFELNTLRCAAILMFSLAGLIVKATWPTIPRDLILSTLGYTLLNYIMAIARFVAITLLPVTTVKCIIYTARTVSGVVLFAVFLEERVTIKRGILTAFCVFGVVLVIQPDFLFHTGQLTGLTPNFTTHVSSFQGNETMETTMAVTQVTSFSLVALGYILSVISGLTCSLDILLLKKIPTLNEHMFPVLFWFFTLCTFLSVVPMAIFEIPVLPSNWPDALYVITHCLAFVLFWPLYMYSVPLISGNVSNLIWSMDVVFLLMAQYTVLSSIHPGHRNWMEVVGVVVVLLGTTMGSVMEMIKSKQQGMGNDKGVFQGDS